jgi:hypothetical protein
MQNPHTTNATNCNLWFGKMLGNDARRNSKSFADSSEESFYLSYYNVIVEFSQYAGGEFRQAYFTVPFESTTADVNTDDNSDPDKYKMEFVILLVSITSSFLGGFLLGVAGLWFIKNRKASGTENEANSLL